MQPNARIAILRTGTHTSVDGRKFTFSPAILGELAEGYDAKASEAPLVVGHPSLDAPAYGWVNNLRVDGDLLYAEPRQVEPQFAELVNAGRYKNVSASIYLPDSPGNPKPGKHYLKHVGFLGGAAPAVKGLPQVQFAEGSGAVEFAAPLGYVGGILGDLFQRIRDYFVERDGADNADKIIPQWQISSLRDIGSTDADGLATSFAAPSGTDPESTMPKPATTDPQLEEQLNARATELETREQALRTRELQALRSDAAAFAEQLVTEGKLLPRQKDQVVEILVSLPANVAISFAEGGSTVSKPTGEVLRQILTDMPVRVDYREKSGQPGVTDPVSFAAPSGFTVDAGRLELHNKALAHMAQHPNTAYLDAVKAVGG